MAGLPSLEAISEWDCSWYDVDLERSVVACHGDKYGVKIVYQGSDEDEYDVLYAEQLANRLRYSSQPVQDDECRKLQPGSRVAVLVKWPNREEQKYYDAEIVRADFQTHGPEEGQCTCLFKVRYVWDQEPKAKLDDEFLAPVNTRYRIDDICFPGKPALDHPAVQKWLRDIRELTATQPLPPQTQQATEGSSAAGGAEHVQQEQGSAQNPAVGAAPVTAGAATAPQQQQKGLFTISGLSGSAAGTEAVRQHILKQAALAKEAEAKAAAAAAAAGKPAEPVTALQAAAAPQAATPPAAASTAGGAAGQLLTPVAAATAAATSAVQQAAAAQPPTSATLTALGASPQAQVLAQHSIQQAAALQAARQMLQAGKATDQQAAAATGAAQQAPAATTGTPVLKRPADAGVASSALSAPAAKRPRTIIPPLHQQLTQQQQAQRQYQQTAAILVAAANGNMTVANSRPMQAKVAAAAGPLPQPAAGSPAQQSMQAPAAVMLTPVSAAAVAGLKAAVQAANAGSPSGSTPHHKLQSGTAAPAQYPLLQPMLSAQNAAMLHAQMNLIRAAAAGAARPGQQQQQAAPVSSAPSAGKPGQQQPQPQPQPQLVLQLQQHLRTAQQQQQQQQQQAAAIQSVIARMAHHQQLQQKQEQERRQQQADAHKVRRQQQKCKRQEADATKAVPAATAAALAATPVSSAPPSPKHSEVGKSGQVQEDQQQQQQQQHESSEEGTADVLEGDFSCPADANEAQKRYYQENRNGKPTVWIPGPEHGFPKGWYVLERTRVTGASQGCKDRYYLGPDGRVVRSRAEAVAKAVELAKFQLLVDAAEEALLGRVSERSPVSLEGPDLMKQAVAVQQQVMSTLKEHNTLMQMALLPLRLSDITSMAALHSSGALNLLPSAAISLYNTATVHTAAHTAGGRLSQQQATRLLACLALQLEVPGREDAARRVLAEAVGAQVPTGPLPSQVTAAKAAAAAAMNDPSAEAAAASEAATSKQRVMNSIVARYRSWVGCTAEQLNSYLDALMELHAQMVEQRNKALQAAGAVEAAAASHVAATAAPCTNSQQVAAAETAGKSAAAAAEAAAVLKDSTAMEVDQPEESMLSEVPAPGAAPQAAQPLAADAMDVDHAVKAPAARAPASSASDLEATASAAAGSEAAEQAEQVVADVVLAAVNAVVAAAQADSNEQCKQQQPVPKEAVAAAAVGPKQQFIQQQFIQQLVSLRSKLVTQLDEALLVLRAEVASMVPYRQYLSPRNLQHIAHVLESLGLPKLDDWPDYVEGPNLSARRRFLQETAAAALAPADGPGRLPVSAAPAGMQRLGSDTLSTQHMLQQQHPSQLAQLQQQQQPPLPQPHKTGAAPAGPVAVVPSPANLANMQVMGVAGLAQQQQQQQQQQVLMRQPSMQVAVTHSAVAAAPQQQQQQQLRRVTSVTAPRRPLIQANGMIDTTVYGQYLVSKMIQQLRSEGVPSPVMPEDQRDIWRRVAQAARAHREGAHAEANRAAAAAVQRSVGNLPFSAGRGAATAGGGRGPVGGFPAQQQQMHISQQQQQQRPVPQQQPMQLVQQQQSQQLQRMHIQQQQLQQLQPMPQQQHRPGPVIGAPGSSAAVIGPLGPVAMQPMVPQSLAGQQVAVSHPGPVVHPIISHGSVTTPSAVAGQSAAMGPQPMGPQLVTRATQPVLRVPVTAGSVPDGVIDLVDSPPDVGLAAPVFAQPAPAVTRPLTADG